jgi:hypothetical protein
MRKEQQKNSSNPSVELPALAFQPTLIKNPTEVMDQAYKIQT